MVYTNLLYGVYQGLSVFISVMMKESSAYFDHRKTFPWNNSIDLKCLIACRPDNCVFLKKVDLNIYPWLQLYL